MAELIVHDPNTATCPECGLGVEGYESSRRTRLKVNRYEAWEGGPMLEVPTKQVEYEPDGPFITTVQPCGHRVDRIVWASQAPSGIPPTRFMKPGTKVKARRFGREIDAVVAASGGSTFTVCATDPDDYTVWQDMTFDDVTVVEVPE